MHTITTLDAIGICVWGMAVGLGFGWMFLWRRCDENRKLVTLEAWIIGRGCAWQTAHDASKLNRPIQRTYETQIGVLDLVLAQLRAIQKAGQE